MNLRITLWLVIGALFIVVLFLTFKVGSLGSLETIQTVGTATKTATTSYGGMVGGC